MSDNNLKNPIVSIVVPCYNVGEYLTDCLDSLINQTFKDIEIVCVNDGSTDKTLQILDDYAKKDLRIKIITQENKGLSGARNTGVNNSSGSYITFVDSDDWVSENYIEKLYDGITGNNADIAASTIVRWRKKYQKYRVHYTEEKVYKTLEDKVNVCAIPKCCYVWNKLYKAELVKKYSFTEGVYYEDMLWTPNILKEANKLVTVPDTIYYYRVNKNSIVKKKPSDKKQLDSYNSHKYIVDFFEENNLNLVKKFKQYTKKIIYFTNVPIARIKEYEGWNTFYLFNFIPLFKYSKTRYRDFYKFWGLKLTIRKNKKNIQEIRSVNERYEQKGCEYPHVYSRQETLEKLVNSSCSMCRYGDGEFNLIFGENLPFQNYNRGLAKRLSEILKSEDENILICIPNVFNSLNQYTQQAADFWRKFLYYNRKDVENYTEKEKKYYDTEVTRPYMDIADKTICRKYFDDFKQVWNGQSIVIVEGEASRLGVGNDLFKNVASIKRILCPAKNSYSRYEDILKECLKLPEESLYIIALGPTATVLAYDLAKNNRRALDLGHIDIEYEWFLMGVTEKVPIKNKYVNECRNGKVITKIDDKEYLSQICADFSKEEQN